MEQFQKEMRRFYYLTSLPTIAFFALAYFTAEVPLLDQKAHYLLLVIFYVLTMVAVLCASRYWKRAVVKTQDDVEKEDFSKRARAFRIRIWTLNIITYATAPIYYITMEQGCIYLFFIMILMLLISFPSEKYLLPND